MTIKRITTVLLSLSVVAVLLLIVMAVINNQTQYLIIDIVGLALTCGLLIAHLNNFRWSGQVFVVGVLIITLGGIPQDPSQQLTYAFNVLTPVVLAAVLLPWYWSIAVFLVCYIGMAIVQGGQGMIFSPSIAILLFLQAGGIALASLVSRLAQQNTEATAQRLRVALEQAEQQQQMLAEQTATLSQQNEEQQRLLELVTTLEVPIISLANQVLFAPLVGSLDSRRAQELTNRLLNAVSKQRAHLVILDVAGIATIDTNSAQALITTTQAVRLLGCEVIISGIAVSVATTLTHLNINFDELQITRSPQEALELYQELTAKGVKMNGFKAPGYENN
jgi:rsbT co-antagonist protein RsbR